MTIRGPDPDKSAYRFRIHAEVQRWENVLRPRWVEHLDEDSAKEIDEEFARCTAPETFDDATHARDTLDFIRRHLDRLEHALGTREQLKRNQTKFAAAARIRTEQKGDDPTVQIDLERRARENAKAGGDYAGYDGPLVVPSTMHSPEPSAEIEQSTIFAALDGMRVEARLEEPVPNDPAYIPVRFERGIYKGRFLLAWSDRFVFLDEELQLEAPYLYLFTSRNISRASRTARGPRTHIYNLEATKTDADFKHTNFPELSVKVPKELPPDFEQFTDETREEAESRLAQAQSVADVYQREDEARTAAEIANADLRKGMDDAITPPSEKSFVKQWSDKPISEPSADVPDAAPKPDTPSLTDEQKADYQAALLALKEVYKAAGFEIRSTSATPDGTVEVELERDGQTIKVPLPIPTPESDT